MLKLCYGRDEAEYARCAAEAGVPTYMIGSYYRYVERGILPGDFLTAVLSNDLRGAVGQADSVNQECLREHVLFCTWCIPADSWGSAEKVTAWLSREEFHKEGEDATSNAE